eukprot:1950320-Pyramimonas_sp.AAC.1
MLEALPDGLPGPASLCRNRGAAEMGRSPHHPPPASSLKPSALQGAIREKHGERTGHFAELSCRALGGSRGALLKRCQAPLHAFLH